MLQRLFSLLLSLVITLWLALVALRWICATSDPVCLVRSRSMMPAMAPGDMLLVYNGTEMELDVGTVVVFKLPNHSHPIVHRITEKSPSSPPYYVTQGDHNVADDRVIYAKSGLTDGLTRQHIVGTVVARLPKLGKVKLFLAGLLGAVPPT